MRSGSSGRSRPNEAITAMRGPLAWWIVIPLLAAWLLLRRPVEDFDIFWQVRLGDLMIDSGAVLRREPFASTHLGEPLVPLSAAAQVLLAAARRLGGWAAVQWIDAAAWAGGFFLAGLAAWRRGAEAPGLLVALALGLAMAWPFSGVRPQSFAVLCFGALLVLRAGVPTGSAARTLLVGGALFVIWQNLHPSVSLAVIWCGARAGMGLARKLAGRAPEWPLLDAALAGLAALAMFLTPAGFDVLAVSAANARMSIAMGATEWLALTDPANRPFMPVLLVLNACVAALLWLRRKSIGAEDMAGAAALLLLALGSGRFLLFWALAAVPLMAGQGAAGRQPARGAALLMAAGLLAVGGAARVAGWPGVTPLLPGASLALLEKAGGTGPIYASFGYGGIVSDVVRPEQGVVFDGRYYRFSAEEWALVRASRAGTVSAQGLAARYRPSAWLLDPAADAALVADLRRHPEAWREAGGDGAARVFLPAN